MKILGLILVSIILLSGCLIDGESAEEFCQRKLGEEWHVTNSKDLGYYCYKINNLGGREIRDIDNIGFELDKWKLVEE